MELLESLSVPWCRDTRDIIQVLIGARITKPLTHRHFHPRPTPHKTQLCPLDPYSPDPKRKPLAMLSSHY
jgi:hypothetical protein